MKKMSLNRVRLDFDLTPETPLLIKTGDKSVGLLHPERVDLTCVRTGHRDDERVYIPGSSVKGVVRSSAERILRSLGLDCCDPLNEEGDCQKPASRLGDEARKRSEQPHPQAAVYKKVCYGCRTFGSQAIASRVDFADAYPTPETVERANQTERRSGVSLDRRTGGPARGKLFDMEVVTGGRFAASVHLQNVQLWQLALLGIVLHEIDDGFVRLGSAKSRGLGHVRLHPRALSFAQLATDAGVEAPAGVAALRSDLVEAYDLVDEGELATGLTGESDPAVRYPYRGWRWRGDAVWIALDRVAEASWDGFCARGRRAGGA